jgi:Flp pilus assembly protein TadD
MPAGLDTRTARLAALPAVIATVVLLFLAASEGGRDPLTWYPAGILLAGLLAVAVTFGPPTTNASPVAGVAFALLLAFAAWSYCSIAWADQQADAWNGANRAVIYASVFGLYLWPLPRRTALAIMAFWALGVAAIGLVELVRAAVAASPDGYFVAQRFSEPTGYANANAALWFTAALLSVFLSSRPELPVPLRAGALAGTVLLIGLTLMAGSRGWLFAGPVGVVALLVLVHDRFRLAIAMGVAGIATVFVAGPAIEVFDAFSPSELPKLLDEAATRILSAAGVAGLLWLAIGHVGRRVRLRPSLHRRLNRGTLIALIVAGAGALGAWQLAGDPISTISDGWEEFKGGEPRRHLESRFSGELGSNRYDFWRVAWRSFRDQPVQGAGSETFLQQYLAEGESREQPRYPHSLEIGVLSQTGVVGALLLLGGLAAAFWSGIAAMRRSDAATAAVAGGAVAVSLYWLAHASVDWFWEFPAVTGPALALLALAAGMGRETRPPEGGRARLRLTRVASLGIALAAAVSLALPWAAELQLHRARSSFRANPAKALEKLDAAASLNPLSSEPKLTAGLIATRRGDFRLAESQLRDALARERRNAYVMLQLGAAVSQQGRRAEALRLVREARELTPRDPIAAYALRRVRRTGRVDPRQLSRRVLARLRKRLE